MSLDGAVPVIYLIDDDPTEDVAALNLRGHGVHAERLHPLEVGPEHLQSATLLAVDQYFDLTDPSAGGPVLDPAQPIATRPSDGLALSAVLRSASRKLRSDAPPLGIVLRTGQLDLLTTGLPRRVRAALVSAQHDLEWVVSKSVTSPIETSPTQQLIAIARALSTYPLEWPSGAAGPELLAQWLQLPASDWSQLARRQIGQCRPPTRLHSDALHGLAWFRWLATRALPYPTFVYSYERGAASLGITVDSLRVLEHDTGEIGDILRAAHYTGPLHDLHPPLLWRAAIKAVAMIAAGAADADDPFTVGEALSRQTSGVTALELNHPVVCIDADDYFDISRIEDRTETVRLAPDDWPAYADIPLASAEDQDDPAVVALRPPVL